MLPAGGKKESNPDSNRYSPERGKKKALNSVKK